MVVLPQQILENLSQVKACNPTTSAATVIPMIDLLDPTARDQIVKACYEFGFFKVVNHGVPLESMTKLEEEAVKFFNLPQLEKEQVGHPNPFGYGHKKIGPNGDVGWVEYLFLSTHNSITIPGNSQLFKCLVKEYVGAVRNTACEVLEMIAEGLKMEPKDVLSRLIRDENSDCWFRVNHYPPCPELQTAGGIMNGGDLIGFGEHTDPQVISVVRSNNTTGLQISVGDGTWLSVPPDHHSLFINVGDSLQVMSNGRFKSVKHRVLADSMEPRLSMIYFGGPPLSEKIAPLSCFMEEGEESLYNEFTWGEFMKSAYKNKLAVNRLLPFEKKKSVA
ncbi:PREDICTED: gibberellin 2-beta-dioxygenase 1-like [Ipomoea nil]|uniref:gibberellin 2-beta-dioxygenase 1-like n=1 Tax=Ipomoea nil TaxID=35883 RepID=UPI0009011DD1|nr:PREDICTED: gibberellin 2-beta-dioxygenase 1-like [Ipomoea nil]